MTREKKGHRKPTERLSVGLFIVLLFIGSAVLRILSPSTAAVAQEAISLMKDKAPAIGDSAKEESDAPLPEAPLARELHERRRDLAAREKEIDMREKELNIIREQVELRIDDLKAAERELKELVKVASNLAAEDVENLTMVYENMKPKRAGALFEKMEPNFAAGFLRGMSPEAASQILTEMSAESAYALSVVIAGQHQDIPE